MKELLNDINSRDFKPLYLLHGDEHYLVSLYEAKLRAAVPDPAFADMNTDTFEGKGVTNERIELRAATLPFMSERRLLVVRESGLFAAGRKDDSERLADFCKRLPPACVLVFVEREADKRTKAYKAAAAAGRVVEFGTPSEQELGVWIKRLFKELGKTIAPADAARLLRYTAGNMHAVVNEAAKLAAYAGNAETVTASHIEAVCVKPAEARVFELVDAVAAKNARRALECLANLLAVGESPLMVLVMLARQYRIILMCSECAAGGLGTDATAAATGLRGFMVSSALKQARGFTYASLAQALHDCAETDHNVKTGRLQDRLGLELLIVRHCAKI
ncbi:MAG: DNA polymerase III subunit delta [Defluviitaleaceae bacterium]|nr:DNA polymerase III subunit delta [Defluviitaleaceae bacterium]